MHDYRKLKVWQEGRVLVRDIYRATASFPKSEMYGLTSQARRAAVGIPAQIAEGSGRGTQLGFLTPDQVARLLERLTRVRQMAVRFRQRLRRNPDGSTD